MKRIYKFQNRLRKLTAAELHLLMRPKTVFSLFTFVPIAKTHLEIILKGSCHCCFLIHLRTLIRYASTMGPNYSFIKKLHINFHSSIRQGKANESKLLTDLKYLNIIKIAKFLHLARCQKRVSYAKRRLKLWKIFIRWKQSSNILRRPQRIWKKNLPLCFDTTKYFFLKWEIFFKFCGLLTIS